MAGLAGIQQQLLIRFAITGDATGGDEYTVTRLLRAVDSAAIITAGNAAGRTVRFYKGTAATFVTGTMTAAAGGGAVARPQQILHANAQLNAGDTLGLIAQGAGADAVRADVRLEVIPPLADITTIT